MPTRVEQCPNHGPCMLFRCTRGSHKLLGRHDHAAIQAPTTPRWTALPAVRSVLRSVAAVAHVALASSLSLPCSISPLPAFSKGEPQKPEAGSRPDTVSTWKSFLAGAIPPRGRPEPPPIGRRHGTPSRPETSEKPPTLAIKFLSAWNEGTSGPSRCRCSFTVKSH